MLRISSTEVVPTAGSMKVNIRFINGSLVSTVILPKSCLVSVNSLYQLEVLNFGVEFEKPIKYAWY
jgi:hypothetical protein